MIIYPSQESAMLAHLGLDYLSIPEAAALICKCLVCEGELEVGYDLEVVSIHDKKLEEALKPEIDKMIKRLLSAAEKSLEVTVLQRNIDETLIPERTYVDVEKLNIWLEARGVYLGDLFHDDFLGHLADLYEAAEKTIEREKFREY